MNEQRQGQEFTGTEPSGLAARPTSGTAQDLSGRKVAVILADGFEQTEYATPAGLLREAGATVDVISEQTGHVEGESQGHPAEGVEATRAIADVRPEDYDALMIPGGLKSPDTMRQSEAFLNFVRGFVQADKPIGAICHGPWLLANVDALQGKTVTSWPAIQHDLTCSGATWKDEQVVQDGNLVFSRKPDDAEAFGQTLITLIGSRAAR